MITSSLATFFPVIAKRVPRLRIPLYVYLFARYFGAGVIVATAFIHLLDPAYQEIGPQTCVGMTGGWAQYSWCPAIVLTSVVVIFLCDVSQNPKYTAFGILNLPTIQFGAERYVEIKYGIHLEQDIQGTVTDANDDPDALHGNARSGSLHIRHMAEQYEKGFTEVYEDDSPGAQAAREQSFRQQIAAFLILEFGVIFHSVIIGLNLGVAGSEFSTLYVVLVFHQSFEGLGIGARMSVIPFKKGSWLPWLLCSAYGLTTPVAIAIGLALRT